MFNLGVKKLKLSKKSEYACLALIDLAENHNKGLVKIEDISNRKNIPKKFLEQILLNLKSAGYVKSVRGPEGGYKLAKEPCDITLAETIRFFDGALAPVESVSIYFYEHTPIEQNEKLLGVFREVRDFIANKLESTTYKDLI